MHQVWRTAVAADRLLAPGRVAHMAITIGVVAGMCLMFGWQRDS